MHISFTRKTSRGPYHQFWNVCVVTFPMLRGSKVWQRLHFVPEATKLVLDRTKAGSSPGA